MGIPNLPRFPNLAMNGYPIPDVPWTEFIGRTGSVTEKNFSYNGGNQITMSFLVNDEDEDLAVQDLLGVNKFNRVTGNVDRVPPAQHPRYYWLYCSGVNCKSVRWRKKNQLRAGSGSQYDFSLITAVFTQPKYRVLDDLDLDVTFPPVAGVRQEWWRFVEFVPQVGQETITRDKGEFQWAESGPGGANPTINTPFTAPVPMQLAKGDYVFLWRKVPLIKGLLGSLSGLADNLLAAAKNPVNSVAFMGAPAGTLRFNGARITPIECPLAPTTMGLPLSDYPSLVADVEVSMSQWDPPYGSTHRGHNLAPFADAANGNNNWFLITVDGNPAHASIYGTSDLSNIFRLPG